MNTIVSTLNLDAAPIFQAIVATMTQEQSAPLVQKIEAYASAAMASIATVVANTPSLAKYANSVAQAQEVLTLIEAFVTGVTTGPVSARAPVPVPLLHR
jgi:BioD-like phosphotransacetylase family protein